jgi:hypothetical protein
LQAPRYARSYGFGVSWSSFLPELVSDVDIFTKINIVAEIRKNHAGYNERDVCSKLSLWRASHSLIALFQTTTRQASTDVMTDLVKV